MTQRPLTLTGKEYWVRCPECGDSQKNRDKAHLSINVETGAFHCFRCNFSGYLTSGQLLQVLGRIGDLDFADLQDVEPEEVPELHYGSATNRPSALTRYRTQFRDRDWDAFEYRDVNGEVTGYLLRRKGESYVFGTRSYLYPDPLGGDGTVLRIVEGPYDVLTPQDVAVGGVINPWKVYRDFPLYQFIFTPDGDVWEKDDLLKKFLQGMARVLKTGALVGVEYLPDSKDPDEVPPAEREMLSPREVQKLITTFLRKEVSYVA